MSCVEKAAVAMLSHGCDSISIIFLRVNVYVSFLSDAPARRASAAAEHDEEEAVSVRAVLVKGWSMNFIHLKLGCLQMRQEDFQRFHCAKS